jgi:hypothetical protein
MGTEVSALLDDNTRRYLESLDEITALSLAQTAATFINTLRNGPAIAATPIPSARNIELTIKDLELVKPYVLKLLKDAHASTEIIDEEALHRLFDTLGSALASYSSMTPDFFNGRARLSVELKSYEELQKIPFEYLKVDDMRSPKVLWAPLEGKKQSHVLAFALLPSTKNLTSET